MSSATGQQTAKTYRQVVTENTTLREILTRDNASTRTTRRKTFYKSFSPSNEYYRYDSTRNYHDPYDNLFLRYVTLRWLFHHWNQVDKSRFQEDRLQELEAKIEEMEAQGMERDPNYTMPDVDPDLQYSDGELGYLQDTKEIIEFESEAGEEKRGFGWLTMFLLGLVVTGGIYFVAVRVRDTLYNPLRIALKDMVELTFEEAGTYEVFKMSVYTTQIAEKTCHAVKYFLRDPVQIEKPEVLALELIQSERQETDEKYLFHIIEEFGYDEEFMELLKDDIFVIKEETGGNEVEREYAKTYSTVAQVKTLEKNQKEKAGEVKTWNYESGNEMETYYLTIEMDTDNGWITLYEGRKLLEGEFEVYPVSGGEL